MDIQENFQKNIQQWVWFFLWLFHLAPFSDEDIQLVSQQAGVDEEKAKSALEEAKGDLARAILLLTTG